MRVLVIGAGVSGLVAIKSALDEGLDVVCYERDCDIGGTWLYKPGKKLGATVYKSTYLNTSKTASSFSDFPMPKEAPNFLHHTKLLQYFRSYAKNFKLLPLIKFNTEVVSCKFADDYETTGRWKVLSRNIEQDSDGVVVEEVFDAVMVAVGHHTDPFLPLDDFPGVAKFPGQVIHSQDYRDFNGFEDKRVLVIGLGNSGADIATELSRHAKRVCASSRKGTWVFPRVGPNGEPIDHWLITRYQDFLNYWLPVKYRERQYKNMLNSIFNHADYGLQPKHSPLRQHPTLSDELPTKILCGAITIKPKVTRFVGRSAQFEDGTSEEFDSVIFCTGYDFSLPFLDDSVVQRKGNDCAFYKYVWPLGLKHNTMAVIGHIQSASMNPLSEIQARWAARVFAGKVGMASQSVMREEIEKQKQWIKQRFERPRHHTGVDHIAYIDEVADIIGCKPNLYKLFLTDPKLAYKMFFENACSFQYRLQGPGSNYLQARKRIMEQRENALYTLRTRKVELETDGSYCWIFAVFVLVAVMLCFCLLM